MTSQITPEINEKKLNELSAKCIKEEIEELRDRLRRNETNDASYVDLSGKPNHMKMLKSDRPFVLFSNRLSVPSEKKGKMHYAKN